MTTTGLSQPEITELVNRWGVGSLASFSRLEAGTINSNYRVETGHGCFFLRVNEGKSDQEVDYEVLLLNELGAAGFLTPQPIATICGNRWVASSVAGERAKQAMLFPWVAGHHLKEADVNETTLQQLGSALASLHNVTAKLPLAMIRENSYNTEAIARRVSVISKRIEADGGPAEIAEVLPLLAAEIAWLRIQEPIRSTSPTFVIHGDVFRDNVLFDGDKLVAFLDFEQAGAGTAVYEVAVCINAWCFISGSFQPNLISALVAGYHEKRNTPLTPAALSIETRAAALRFAVTRITDVFFTGLERPDKSYKRYIERLRQLLQPLAS